MSLGKLGLVAIFLGLTAGTCAAEDSGVGGRVILSPACPGPAGAPESSSPECSPRPMETIVAVFRVSDDAGTAEPEFRVATDSAGHFEIALAPGRYRLVARAPNPLASGQPEDVMVSAGVILEVTLSVDSGLR